MFFHNHCLCLQITSTFYPFGHFHEKFKVIKWLLFQNLVLWAQSGSEAVYTEIQLYICGRFEEIPLMQQYQKCGLWPDRAMMIRVSGLQVMKSSQ